MIKKFSTYALAFLFSLIITWSIGLLIITYKHYLEDFWVTWLYGVINSIIATGLFTLLLAPFYFLGNKLKITPILVHLIFCFILLIEIISLFYFTMTLELLDNTIFQFSWEQANIILDNYFVFKWYYLLLPFPLVIYFLFIRLFTFKYKAVPFYLILIAGIVGLFIGLQIERENGSFTPIPKNKTIFFLNSLINDKKPNLKDFSDKDIVYYQNEVNPKLQNKDYPLYRKTDKENPLKPLFELKETPPNIVFMVVESLSSSFSGPNADEISYTPFLDSLAAHSLYFDNSLATAERSFAVLPSMLGSLPHGKAGFTNNKAGYPYNETLATWLFKNGYVGDFHFGGYARFDYMDLFMDNQGFKNIYDRKEFNYEGTGLKTSIDSIPFGIPDKQFLKSILIKTQQRKTNAPYLDVYLTLSMHYPYMIEDHEAYYQKVKRTIENASAPDNIKKKHHKYIAEFATFLYTDDALQNYFHTQEQRPSHQNTIYIILGDHMMGEIPQSNPIEKYRSVLMIYSPLLKKHQHFKGVNSHLDIPPSFYSLLQNKYNYPTLDSVSWLGKPFDTSHTFHSDRSILFMYNNRNAGDLLHNNLFLSKDKLYKVGDQLQLTSLKNTEKKEKLKKLRRTSAFLHNDVVTQNKLIPNHEDLKLLEATNKEIHINQKVEFGNIFKTSLTHAYEEIIVEMNLQLQGDWTQNSEDKNNPLLVCSIKRGEESLLWEKIDLNLEERPIENKRKLSYMITSNLDFKLRPGDNISIYFWNNEKSSKKYSATILPLTVKGKVKE